jgi:hypothetical protein
MQGNLHLVITLYVGASTLQLDFQSLLLLVITRCFSESRWTYRTLYKFATYPGPDFWDIALWFIASPHVISGSSAFAINTLVPSKLCRITCGDAINHNAISQKVCHLSGPRFLRYSIVIYRIPTRYPTKFGRNQCVDCGYGLKGDSLISIRLWKYRPRHEGNYTLYDETESRVCWLRMRTNQIRFVMMTSCPDAIGSRDSVSSYKVTL